MKVKEFIKQLEGLDMERDIWIVYDNGYAVCPPYVKKEKEGFTEIVDRGNVVRKGDYIIH